MASQFYEIKKKKKFQPQSNFKTSKRTNKIIQIGKSDSNNLKRDTGNHNQDYNYGLKTWNYTYTVFFFFLVDKMHIYSLNEHVYKIMKK